MRQNTPLGAALVCRLAAAPRQSGARGWPRVPEVKTHVATGLEPNDDAKRVSWATMIAGRL